MNENEMATENSMPEVQQRSSKKNLKIIIGGLLVVALIAVGLVFGYQKLNANPTGIYKKAINNVYEGLNNALKEAEKNSFNEFDLSKDSYVADVDVKLTSSMEELKGFSGLNYNFSVGLDYSKELASVDASIKENGSSVISAALLLKDKVAYLKSADLFSKVISLGEMDIFGEIDLDELAQLNINYDDMEYVLKEMKTILINSLDKNKFETAKEKITIEGKEYNANKVTYVLDKENMERTSKYIKEEMLKNEKLLQTLANLSQTSVDEIKEELNKDTNVSYDSGKVILYTTGMNKIIAGSILDNENNEVITFNDAEHLNITAIMDEIKIEYKEIDKNKSNVLIYQDEEEIANLEMAETANGYYVDFKVTVEGVTLKGSLALSNIKRDNNKMSADFKFNIDSTILGKKVDVTLEGNYTIAKKSVDTFDTTGSVSMDNISAEEMTNAYSKLSEVMEKLGLNQFMGTDTEEF